MLQCYEQVKIKEDFWDVTINCLFCTLGNLEDYIKNNFDKDLVVITEHITKNYKGTTIIMPTGEIILWMPDIPKTSVALGTLSHEVFHITKYILKDIQCIPLNDDTEEIYATTLGRIIELITNKLNPSII
tara:strand:+ start:55 stop:444 length:390 start_codon:yes stop_codon:yes gene_type:complete